MRIKGNPNIVDEVLKPYLDLLPTIEELAKIGRMACEDAILKGGYTDRTHNLRNAYGYAVVYNGKIVAQEILDRGSHEKAIESTTKMLESAEGQGDGLYIANGMFYASFVEAKHFNVLTASKIKAEELYKQLMKGEI